jgi:hypothetical protein
MLKDNGGIAIPMKTRRCKADDSLMRKLIDALQNRPPSHTSPFNRRRLLASSYVQEYRVAFSINSLLNDLLTHKYVCQFLSFCVNNSVQIMARDISHHATWVETWHIKSTSYCIIEHPLSHGLIHTAHHGGSFP